MDTLSHALYGGVAFGRSSRFSYWLAFFFGMMPDLFSFGIFFISRILGMVSGPDFDGPPPLHTIPTYVHDLYNVTHSLVVATIVITILCMIRKKLIVELFAWPLHILVDIPTHSSAYFPTPFLWPLSDFHIDGISWGHWFIFYPNVLTIIALYTAWYVVRKRARQKEV